MNSESTDILAALVLKAVALNTDGLQIEYKDSHEEVTATKDNIGIGIASLRSGTKEAIALRDELWKHRRKIKKLEIGGVSYKLKVTTFESFGETAFRVEIKGA